MLPISLSFYPVMSRLNLLLPEFYGVLLRKLPDAPLAFSISKNGSFLCKIGYPLSDIILDYFFKLLCMSDVIVSSKIAPVLNIAISELLFKIKSRICQLFVETIFAKAAN